VNLKPLLFALLLTATGCRRTTRSDDQADGGPPRLDYPRVVVGTDDSCLLDAAGYLSCWGRQPASHQPPKRAFAFVDLDTSGCGLARDGTLTCWPAAEMNDVGAFPPGRYRVVSTRSAHACAIRLDRTLVCWGKRGGMTNSPGGPFLDVSVGLSHVCAIRADGTLTCWGESNSYRQASPPPGRFVQISSGGVMSCARNADNLVVCWGEKDTFGSLHNRQARSVHTGIKETCVIELDGTLTCKGPYHAAAAPPDDISRPPPGRYVQMDMGTEHACALRADGRVACWGRDRHGETKPPGG